MKHLSLRRAVSLLIVFSSNLAAQSSLLGHWEGTLTREGTDLAVSFDFANGSTALKASFDSPAQRALGIPLRNVTYGAPVVHFELVGDVTTMVFDGEVAAQTIKGSFREGSIRAGQFREGDARSGLFRERDAKGTFSLTRAEVKPQSFSEEEVTFRNGNVTLAGTLLLPLSKGPHPAVVFLHGSGAEGRYASRFLAEQLIHSGIAALIYDKRGVGKSTGDWQRSDFSDLADDAVAAVHLLQQRPEIEPKKIGIQGHSQGGMIAPLVVSRSRDVAFVISTAGDGVPVHEAEVYSMTNQVRSRGISGMDLAEAIEFIKLRVSVARTGEGWDQLGAAIEKSRGARWYRMVGASPKDDWTWAFYRRVYNYNPIDYWGHVSVPALVIYGERDVISPVADSIANIGGALSRAGNRDYTIIILPRASHTFFVERDETQPFEWPRLAPGFPELVTAWISQRTK
jgi:pimeloyl-ACP methyl ester carboxylesterase